MWWTAIPVPFSPLKDDLLTSVRRAQAVFDSGGVARDLGRGHDPRPRGRPAAVRGGRRLPRAARPACRSCRSRSPAPPGRASAAGSWSASASRSRPGRAPDAPGDRALHRADAGTRSGRWSTATGPAAARPDRALADRPVQRLGPGRPGRERRCGPDPADVPIPRDVPDPAARPATAATRASGILGRDERHRAVGQPKEYRARLDDQPDDQIDRWVSELMRDVVKRRGIVKVVADFRSAAQAVSEAEFERVFAFGGGAPRTLGRDRGGPPRRARRSACGRSCPGVRELVADSRGRLIEYLVSNFDELVYV